VPLCLRAGKRELRDGSEIDGAGVLELCGGGEAPPKTASPTVGEYLAAWEPLLAQGGELLHISLSSGVSSAYQAACLAAAGRGVRVMDGKQLCGGLALPVLRACRLRDEGLSADECLLELESYVRRLSSAFLPRDLAFLRAGGRCAALTELGTRLLSLRPSLVVEDGSLVTGGLYRGELAAARLQFLRDRTAGCGAVGKAVFAHTGLCARELAPLEALLRGAGFEELLVIPAGAVITAHCGGGTIGLFFEEEI
jgi:DegV family protein with EDD domain